MSAQWMKATLDGGALEDVKDGMFYIRQNGAAVHSVTLFLTREQAAQWAAVLTEYADGAA